MKFWLTHLFFLLLYTLSAQEVRINVNQPIERYTLAAGLGEYRIGPLEVGAKYRLELSSEADEAFNTVSLRTGGSTTSATNYFWEGIALQEYLRFDLAPGTEAHLVIGNLSLINQAYLPLNQEATASPITTAISSNAEELVSSIFSNQSCFQTANYTYDGFYGLLGSDTISQLGTFSNGLGSTGINQGIIMTTGRVSRATGPNNFTGTTQIYNTTSNDPDLIQLAGTDQLFDVVVVEFDFTPTTDYIDFNYIFASEEYCEAITNNTVDVFAFLISGPGISGPFTNGAENIAVLPDGSSIDVTEINHTNNTAFYRSNVPDSFNEACQTSPPVAPDDIEYDGMTVVLTAESAVIPCETYHLKLIIADVGDPFYDSAVMLEAGSFAAGLVNVSEPGVTAQNGGLTNAPLEGCSDGTLIFSRLDSSDIAQPLTVYFNISPLGTATFGVDYTMPTDSFIIEANQYSDTLLIDIFGDDLTEGTESIILRLGNTCNCTTNTTEFLIVDPPPLALQLPNPDTACTGDPVDLIPIVSGGVGAYDFSWSTGSIDSILSTAYSSGDSLYILSVSDACQQTITDSVLLTAATITATLSGNFTLCNNDTVTIPVILSGAENYDLTIDENGVLVNYSGGPDTIFLSYDSPQSVSLVSVIGDNCQGLASGSALISGADFGLTANLSPVACFGEATGAISLSVAGSVNDYQFNWTDPTLSGTNLTSLVAATYGLSVVDTNGCTLDTTFVITQPSEALTVVIQSSQGQTCSQPGSATLEISGGSGNYLIDWGDGGASTLQRNDLLGGQDYTVSITDGNNCITSIVVPISDNSRTLDASIGSTNGLTLSCSFPIIRLGAAINDSPANYRWRNQSGQIVGLMDSLSVNQAGTYSLVVFDPTNGCLDSQAVIITQSNEFLTLEVEGPTLLSCNTPSLTLRLTTPGFFGPTNVRWIAPTGSVISTVDSVAGIVTPGSYTVIAERIDNGCESMASFIVTEDFEQPSLNLLITPLSCLVDTATLLVQNPGGNYQYDWSTINGNISGQTNLPTLSILAGGTYALRATNLENGCFLDTLAEVEQNGDTLIAIAGTNAFLGCNGEGTTLNGTASPLLTGTAFRWLDSDGNELSSQNELTVNTAGSYTLEVIHPISGCVSRDEIRIDSEGPDSVAYRLSPAPCPEIGATLNVENIFGGTPPYRYFYDDESVSLNENDALTGLTPGTHTLTVEDDNGCRNDVPLLIFESRTFEGVAPTVSIRLGEAATLGFSTDRDANITFINWMAQEDLSCVNCNSPLVTLPLASFTARVQLIDEAGCELLLTQEVFVDRSELVYAPTAFSPYRLDGYNDKFTLYGDPRFVTSIDYLRVFDRWGDLIWANDNFPINDEREGWDGTAEGQELKGDAFVFSALVTYFDGSQEIISGNINILR